MGVGLSQKGIRLWPWRGGPAVRYDGPMTPFERRARMLRIATYASVATAVLLVAAKALAWSITGAVSVLASLVDSLMDAGASLLNLFAVGYALKPADTEHRFGHGKSESLAGLAQATFIGGSAIFLVVHAVNRLISPRPLEDLWVGVAVMVFATAATVVLVAIQRYVIRQTGSTAIRADSLHYVSDLLANLSIILALWLAAAGWPGMDPVFALGIAAYVLYSAWSIAREAFDVLMDRELPAEVQQRVSDIALAHEEVVGVHDLRTRQAGHTKIIQLHLEVDGDLPLREAHRIANEVDAMVRAAYPEADVIIHEDPAGLLEGRRFP
jgi:ferrous-iron efflux pump FieF